MTYSHKNRNWTPERVTLLKRLWKIGYRVDAIAARMHPGCTPKSVTQKAKNLGLTPRQVDIHWTEEAEAVLTARWNEGVSAQRIATEIEAKFQRVFSRNAIIGKARRLQLPTHRLATTSSGNQAIATKRLHARLKAKALKPRRAPSKAWPVIPLPILPPDPERASWVEFEALGDGCRWVHGEVGKGHGYCGAETVPGRSYCLEHFRRVYIQLDVRQRKKHWSDETKAKIKALQEIIEA